jgi:hypothetical protein
MTIIQNYRFNSCKGFEPLQELSLDIKNGLGLNLDDSAIILPIFKQTHSIKII